MHLIVAVLLAGLAQDPATDARLETLQFHFERLKEITVPATLEQEKQAKLQDLEKLLAAGVTSEKSFDQLYRDMDVVRMWLWQNAAAKPSMPTGSFEETEQAWVLKDPQLEFRWRRDDWGASVTHGGQEWKFAPCNDHDIEYEGASLSLRSARDVKVEAFPTGYSVGLAMSLKDFPAMPRLALTLCVNLIGDEIVFELAAPEEPETRLRWIHWPKPLELGNAGEDASVIPLMQGMLLPGNWPQKIDHESLCHSRALYMPWWGQLHGGVGVVTILETDADAGAAYHHPAGGPTRIAPRWHASLGKLQYLRTIRYSFQSDASYVTMAKRYRRYVQEQGEFVSLAEKRAATPALDDVIGKPVIHLGALYHFVPEASLYNKEHVEANHSLSTFDQLAQQLRDVHARGLADAYVHLDGWGFYGYDNGHPDVLPVGQEQGGWEGLRRFADTCDEIGYLFAVHDQYRDFYFNAVSFADALTLTRVDGTREEHSTWCGGPQTILSPRFAPEYVRRNHDLFAVNDVKVKGAYLDVFAVVPLEETAQAAHPVTRAECAEYRRDCFDLLRARGYVVSSEEPADYLVRSLHLVHHGPYATYEKFGGGDATGVPVPLFNLVYHDSILLPWDMGEDGGWGIPKGDAGRLHCLLNAGLPYVGPGADEATLARVHEAADLAQRCAMQEMVEHEFLDVTRRLQRTTFADGTQVTVDFDKKEATIQAP